MSVIAVRNADQMMISADIRDDGIFVSYADGKSGVVPFGEIKGIGGPAAIERLELPNPYEVVLVMTDGSREELPWDFVRWHCDDSFGARTESTLLREREAVRRRRVEVDPSDAIIGLTHKLSVGGNFGAYETHD